MKRKAYILSIAVMTLTGCGILAGGSNSDNITDNDDTVEIGFGKRRQKDITGSIGHLNVKKDPNVCAYSTIYEYLEGRVAGVSVEDIGGSKQIIIRGAMNIDMSPAPALLIVDGTEVNDIGFINPNDVKSVDVLKDASSCAIYGDRGANGVVIITTKTGND